MLYILRRKDASLHYHDYNAIAVLACNQEQAREIAARWNKDNADAWLDEKQTTISKVDTTRGAVVLAN